MNKEQLHIQQAEMRERTKEYRKKITFHKEVHELFRKGLSYTEISKRFGVSQQYIQQIVRPPKPIRNLVVQRANGRCQDCNVELKSGHIHHANPNIEGFNDPEHLLYLCNSCHIHRHNPPVPDEDMDRFNFARRVLYYKRKKTLAKDLARELGVSTAHLSNILAGIRNPGSDLVKKITDGVSIRDVSASSATLRRIRESMATPPSSEASN